MRSSYSWRTSWQPQLVLVYHRWDKQLARVKPWAPPVPCSRAHRAGLSRWNLGRMVPAAVSMLDEPLRRALPLGKRAQVTALSTRLRPAPGCLLLTHFAPALHWMLQ